MALADTILSNELLVSVLTIALLGAVLALRNVGPRRALLVEPIRTVVFRLLDPLARQRGRPLVRDKTDATEEAQTERLSNVTNQELAKALWDAGYRWNPIATKKYRDTEHGRQWSFLSVAYRDSVTDGQQHHVYAFRNPDGTVDLYAHREPSITDPEDHHGGNELEAGDPAGRLDGIVAALD